MKQRWSEEQIWNWYRRRPWITGFNFIPSGAMDGVIWMLQNMDTNTRLKNQPRKSHGSQPGI